VQSQFERTIAYYDQNSEAFAERAFCRDMREFQTAFLEQVREGGRILDAGCGPGRDTREFLRRGYVVSAIDASSEMVRLCRENTGVPAVQLRMEEIEGQAIYDGVWARASLLHVPRIDLPDVMGRLRDVLSPGGAFYGSFQQGTGERLDEQGRLYSDMSEAGLRSVLDEAGLEVVRVWATVDEDRGPGHPDWVHALARRSA